MTEERIKALDRIGFTWVVKEKNQPDDSDDESHFSEEEESAEIQKDEDNDVAAVDEKDSQSKISNGNHSGLASKRAKQLQEDIFHYDSDGIVDYDSDGETSNEKKWHSKFRELREYKRLHGDCNVSATGSYM